MRAWRQKEDAAETEREEKDEAVAKKTAQRRRYEEKCEEWDAREVPEDEEEVARKQAEWFRVHEKLYTFEVREKMALSVERL